MMDTLSISPESVQLIKQAPHAKDLIDGKVACATVMAYNEYWDILDKGVPASDLILINPALFQIPHIEDGLYVLLPDSPPRSFENNSLSLLEPYAKAGARPELPPHSQWRRYNAKPLV